AAVQWAGQRAHGRRQGGRDVCAGGGYDARREGRCVHAVLGGGDPVGVDRLHVVGVGLPAPAYQEALGDRARLVDVPLRHGELAGAAGGLGDEREGHHGGAGQVVARLFVVDIEQLL